MNFKDFTAGQDDNQRRLDKVLRNFLDTSRLSEIYKLIRKGLIKVNNKKTSPDYRVVVGDVISIAGFLFDNSESSKVSNEKKCNGNLSIPEIVFENQHLLIINKPYNINVHGDSNSLDKLILEYYKSKYTNESLSFTPGPLHRLDKKTTGLLAFSLSLEGARWFSENIQSHAITKNYYGLVEGVVKKTEIWEDFIHKNESSKGFKTVTASENNNESKSAVTIVTPIAVGKFNNNSISLVSFNIKTGRKHQIRSQSALHKHPLLGDIAYKGMKLKNQKCDFYLHAYELKIPENNLGLPSEIKIPLPDDFIEMLKYCGINNIEV